MTVAEFIKELELLPQHYPILCDSARVAESIRSVDIVNLHKKIGPVAIIRTVFDKEDDDLEGGE